MCVYSDFLFINYQTVYDVAIAAALYGMADELFVLDTEDTGAVVKANVVARAERSQEAQLIKEQNQVWLKGIIPSDPSSVDKRLLHISSSSSSSEDKSGKHVELDWRACGEFAYPVKEWSRYGLCTLLCDVNYSDVLFIVGGADKNGRYCTDMLRFDLSCRRWLPSGKMNIFFCEKFNRK